MKTKIIVVNTSINQKWVSILSEQENQQWLQTCQDSGTFGNINDYSVQIINLDTDYDYQLSLILDKRRAEYPTAEQFLDAYFDGGEAGIEQLRKLRLAVKAKYPKPIK